MKKETLVNFAEKKYLERLDNYQKCDFKDGVLEGAKWQQEKSYSEEDVILYSDYVADCRLLETYPILNPKEWFEQFKKKQ